MKFTAENAREFTLNKVDRILKLVQTDIYSAAQEGHYQVTVKADTLVGYNEWHEFKIKLTDLGYDLDINDTEVLISWKL
jgi:hypothetical protein